jgi:thiamine-phosphate pyrophosphorylase
MWHRCVALLYNCNAIEQPELLCMLVVISNPSAIADEAIIINELFDVGMQLFHLRKPGYSKDELRELLNKINPQHYSKIALHQYHEMANDFGITRIHLTEKNRSELNDDELRKLKEANILSTSVHSIESYKTLSKQFDYAFFGPVFNSISKQGYTAVVDNEFNLSGIKTSTKIIAIGGINEENINKVFDMGFDGVALLGAIWQAPVDVVTNLKKIMNRCRISAQ